jgi:drug/metabolite transporter (DMT)-like permease
VLIWALLSSVIFVASNIFIRFYLGSVHWLALIWSRALGTTIILGLLVYFNDPEKLLPSYFTEIGNRPLLWLLTLSTGFLGIWGFIKSIKLLPLYIVIPFSTLNLVTVLVSHFRLDFPIENVTLVGLFLGLIGLFLLLKSQYSSKNKRGWFWMILCVISWGLTYPLSQSLIQSTSPIFFASAMEVSVVFGASLLLVSLNKSKRRQVLSTLPSPVFYSWMVGLLVLGVICDGIARESVSPISMLAFAGFSEIGVLVLGHFFYQDQLRPIQWLGAFLTFVAMFLVLA